MNVDLGIWVKLTRAVIMLLLVAAFFGVGVLYWPLIRQNERMRKQILQLDAQIKQEQEKNRKLDLTIQALRDDAKAVERLARERLGYAKPGETVIVFEENRPTNSVK